MVQAKVRVKKWGSSLGLILPKEVVRDAKIKAGQEIEVIITQKVNLSKIFGTLKFKKSAQEIKDEMRKGWEPEH